MELHSKHASGCERIFEGRISGAKAERQGLSDALEFIREGDTLVGTSRGMGKYELVPEAEWDLLEIALYGFENFGLVQTEQYYEGLVFRFQEVANYPLQYQSVDHIRPGYRRSLWIREFWFGLSLALSTTTVYNRIQGQRVSIMRILGRQDMAKAFPL